MQAYDWDSDLQPGNPAPGHPGMGGDPSSQPRTRRLPNSGVQDHGDGDVEVAQGFGHFLTANDILRASDKTQGSSRVMYDESRS